ncbi:MAG: hypothetical protein QW327_06300, partial [Candidatus Odinarchaeota archaeon]
SISGIVFAMLGGYFSDKKYRRGLWIAVPLTFLSLILFLIPVSAGVSVSIDLFLSCCIGALVWIPQGPIWSLPKIIEPEYPNTAMTMLVVMTGVTVTLFPVFFGALVDFTGSFFYSYIFTALTVFLASLVSYRIRN